MQSACRSAQYGHLRSQHVALCTAAIARLRFVIHALGGVGAEHARGDVNHHGSGGLACSRRPYARGAESIPCVNLHHHVGERANQLLFVRHLLRNFCTAPPGRLQTHFLQLATGALRRPAPFWRFFDEARTKFRLPASSQRGYQRQLARP